MSDRERVESWFESGVLLRPDAAVPNSVDLARAIARMCGARLDPPRTDGERAIAGAIGKAEHVVLAVVDGLGMNLFESLPEGSLFRRALAMELRAVFPSTTAAALTSLATGAWPGEHAVLSWWLYLPDADVTATILPFVERWSRRPLGELGVDAACAFPAPALAGRFTRAAHTYMPQPIANSTYSRYSSAGAPTSGWRTLDDGVDAISQRIAAADGVTYSYFYIPQVDAAEHDVGPHGGQTRAALLNVERALSRLSAALDGRARIVVTADHGVLETPASSRHVIASFDELPELRFARTGEPRVPFFHVHDGEGERFAARFRERFGERFALLTVAEAEGMRLFGPSPMSEAARARVGDYIAVSDGPDVIAYGVEEALRGYHAGLSPAEMRVPLIVV
jgi:hypothetical protein